MVLEMISKRFPKAVVVALSSLKNTENKNSDYHYQTKAEFTKKNEEETTLPMHFLIKSKQQL
jgi:hypothetical protein